MESEIKSFIVCTKYVDGKKTIKKVMILYSDYSTAIVSKEEADIMIRKMYKSLSREEVRSKVHFLSENKFVYMRNRYSNRRKRKKKVTKAKITIFSTTLALAVGTGFCIASTRSSKEDSGFKIVKVKRGSENEETTDEKQPIVVLAKDKNFYDLINMSSRVSTIQSNEMMNISLFLSTYNGSFSKRHKEDGIKPALKWDEVISLDLAYNDYSDPEINYIFNGTKLDKDNLYNNYKQAIKQLTEAFIIEDKKCPIQLSILNNNVENKNIYERINLSFKKAKDSNEKRDIKKLCKKINKNKNNNSVMLMIEPIVKSSNILFKDEFDKDIVDYYNNADYDNYIKDKFHDYTYISNNNVNERLPLYKQFKDSKINQLKEDKMYNIKSRNLKLLDEYNDNISNSYESSKVYTYSKI